MNHNIFERIRMIKSKDIIAIFKFLLAVFLVPFFYSKRKKTWLICEDEQEARDNGYWLYKYICENDKLQDVVYAIDYSSPDFNKVKDVGKTCKYGSINHWLYYLCGEYNISSQKGGKPNAAVCYVLEIYGIIKNKNIFLQHGITLNNGQWLHYKNTKMRLFICGAQKEYSFIDEYFGYPKDNLKLLGFPRFDQLYDIDVDDKMILIMPTWREWLNYKTNATNKLHYDGVFEHSDYYKYWNELLTNKRFINFIEKNNYKVIFFPHRNAQKYLKSFSTISKNVILSNWKDYDIQFLLKKAVLLITDYSSVAIDFAYMNKPVLYYTFDIADFRLGQYEEGYFDYDNNELGYSVKNIDEIISICENLSEVHFKLNEEKVNNINYFFGIRDKNNCQRIIDTIKEL